MPTHPPLSLRFVVVAHQSAAFLESNLPSLTSLCRALASEQVEAHITVVDNASTDGSAALVNRLAPDAVLVDSSTNVGYGAALNRAVCGSTDDWIVCANPDVSFTEMDAARLADAVRSAPAADAVLAPAILDRRGEPCASTGPDPAIASLLAGLMRPPAARLYYRRRPEPGAAVDWATGACLVVRGHAWAAVDGFDSEFFLYYDDTDFCRRLREAGFQIRFLPQLRVAHQAPHHGRPRSGELNRIIMESRRHYFRKHRPRWERAVLDCLEPIERLFRRIDADEAAARVARSRA